MPDQPVYHLQLTPLQGDVPVPIRMRGLLKVALRRFGFRLVDYKVLPLAAARMPTAASAGPEAAREPGEP